MPEETSPDRQFQTGPIEDQHSQPADEKAHGILQQEEADLAGHEESAVLSALRQRFNDAGVAISEDELLEHAHRIAQTDPGTFAERN